MNNLAALLVWFKYMTLLQDHLIYSLHLRQSNEPTGLSSRDYSSYDGLDMFGPTVHQVSFSTVYQPELKHANVYCEMCNTIAGGYYHMGKAVCT